MKKTFDDEQFLKEFNEMATGRVLTPQQIKQVADIVIEDVGEQVGELLQDSIDSALNKLRFHLKEEDYEVMDKILDAIIKGGII